MQRFSRGRMPSPGLIVAVAALTLALTGTAIGGVATISALSKGEKAQVKRISNRQITKRAPGLSVASAVDATNATNATTAAGVGPNGVDTDAIQANAVTSPKIAADAVTQADIAADAVRASELGPTQLAVGANAPIAANGNASASVACPAGTQVLSGGGTSSSFNIVMVTSFQQGNGWIVAYHNTAAAAGTITPIATCLSG